MIERMTKALMTMEKPSEFFASLSDGDRALVHEVYDLIGVPQNPKYHPEGDAFVHTMMVIDAAAAVRSRAVQPENFMLAALVHDLGKKTATGLKENGDWHSIGHERKGLPLIRAMLKRIGANEKTIEYCENMCRLHMRVHTCCYGKAGIKATDRLFSESICPQDLALVCICDSRGKGAGGAMTLPEEQYIMERLHHYLKYKKEREQKQYA